ncbi:MAG: AI-2E family transporter [Minisyncoccia bacterium]
MPDHIHKQETELSITTGSWVRGVLVIVAFIALFLIKDLLLIFLTSIVIASAIEPVAAWAKRRRIPRVPTILVIYVSTAIIFAGMFYFLFLPLLGELSGFIKSFPEYSNTLANDPMFLNAFGTSSLFSNVANSISVPDLVGHVNTFVESFSKGAFSSASFIFGGFFSFIIIIILSFYLAVQEDGVGKFLKVVTPWKQEKYIMNLWRRSQTKIGLWMQGQVILAVIIAVLVYLGLLLIGVEHALLLATAAGLLEIIPLFGPIIAAIPAVLIAFSGGMTQALVVAGLFLIVHQFENQLIYPLVVKKVVGVPPMVSIVALLVGGALGGFLGIVISVPMATIIMEYFADLEEDKKIMNEAFGKIN